MSIGNQSLSISGVPVGVRGLIHVWGRNNASISQTLGIHWIVKDPSGAVAEDYQDWEYGDTNPGEDHQFIGGRFDMTRPGTWTISIVLFLNRNASVIADSYDGILAIVEGLSGTIVKKELEYNEHRGDIPVL